MGITYIDREEDNKKGKQPKAQSALFDVFQKAGYQGNEDEFYSTFMPDASREDQDLLYQAGTNKGISFDFDRYMDPFETIGELGDLLDAGPDESKYDFKFNVRPETQLASYFKLGDLGDPKKEEPPEEQAQSLLGEFADPFKRKKGLSPGLASLFQ